MKLVKDLEDDGYNTDFYSQCGVYLLKKNEAKLPELKELAESRKELSPMIGNLEIITKEEIQKIILASTTMEMYCMRVVVDE